MIINSDQFPAVRKTKIQIFAISPPSSPAIWRDFFAFNPEPGTFEPGTFSVTLIFNEER